MPPVPFVAGIQDYCDQWCRRCPCTSQCLDFAIDQRVQEKGEECSPGEESPQERALEEIASEWGVPVEILDTDELWELREELEYAEDDNDEGALGLILSGEEVYHSFCIYEWLIDEHHGAIYLLLDEIEDEAGGIKKIRRVEDLLAEVDWHLDLLFAKLKRAYHVKAMYPSGEKPRALADADGSAKVALISVDASIRAWRILREELPTVGNKIGWMITTLEQIGRDVTACFPGAPAFKRPGFDA